MSDFDKAAYWFDGADYDLQTAQACLKHGDCYMWASCVIRRSKKR